MNRVESGLERWLRGLVDPVPSGARIGLLLHPASVDSTARHALELVLEAGRHRVERLFAPEHGLQGHEQDMETVGSSVEPASGLPVTSLYGASAESLRPRAEDLEGLEAVVCDLQDIGSRYYTFVYTMSYVMEAAREADVAVVVLDRPNPLGGNAVDGPVLSPSLSSFVGRYPLPVCHGMTVGELARMFNEEFGIGCDLRVVEMTGWRRSMSFAHTGLPWVPPSPNMPTLATAQVYPGGCLIEGTNLSEGRGTTTPFELIGAPWLDAGALADAMRAERLPGVMFRAASFRPMFQKHAGEVCRGVQVICSDPDAFRAFITYVALIRHARRLAPDAFAWRTDAYEFETERLAIDLLFGRADVRPLLEAGATIEALETTWRDEASAFDRLRRGFLRYPA